MRTGLSSLPLALIVATLASAQPNTISTYAGGGPVNGPALSINVAPLGVAATANGDVYFASLTAVYKVSGGIAILIAGTPGIFGFNGDNGPAARAALSHIVFLRQILGCQSRTKALVHRLAYNSNHVFPNRVGNLPMGFPAMRGMNYGFVAAFL